MKTLSQLLALLLLPTMLLANISESDILAVLGKDIHSEVAQSFIKELDANAQLPERSEFTYNFYHHGLSIRITDGKWIQAIRLYGKTMLFEPFSGDLPYQLDFTNPVDLNEVYKVVKYAPLLQDEERKLTIYPNKLPVDYLMEFVQRTDNSLLTMAWMIPENVMEEKIAAANPINIEGFDHAAVWEFLGQEMGSAGHQKVVKHPQLQSTPFDGWNKQRYTDIGMSVYVGTIEKVKRVRQIFFFRRKVMGEKGSFPGALPPGLHWWSTPEEFAEKMSTEESAPTYGHFIFTQTNDKGKLSAKFTNNMLIEVHYLLHTK